MSPEFVFLLAGFKSTAGRADRLAAIWPHIGDLLTDVAVVIGLAARHVLRLGHGLDRLAHPRQYHPPIGHFVAVHEVRRHDPADEEGFELATYRSV